MKKLISIIFILLALSLILFAGFETGNSLYSNLTHKLSNDFAIFGNTVTIGPGKTYTTTEIWNGNEHEDGHGNDFGNILQHNTRVITGIYRSGTPTHYIDQTIAATPTTGYMPNKPSKPSGATNGNIGVEYTYSSSTTDSQGGDIYYWFDWGDDNNSGWMGPIESGETIEASHTWSSEDSYQVRVKAKDPEGHESVWSDPLLVSITKSRSISVPLLNFLQKFLQIHPNMFPLLNLLL